MGGVLLMNTSRLQIRAPVGADVPAIAAIYADAVLAGTATFEIDPPAEGEMARRMEALLDASYPFLVAELDGHVLGYAYAGPYRSRPAYRYTVEDSVYIAPAVHRRGIGAALLAAVVQEGEMRGFRQMIAVIGDSGNSASIALHRSAGFEMAGILRNVGYKFGRWIDTVLMQRRLGAGADQSPSI